jgi:hypothetical protein
VSQQRVAAATLAADSKMAPSLPLRLAALALAACAPAAAQSFGPITALPGLAVLPPYKMSSGYINYTSPMLGSAHNTFHWVAESQGNPATDPILLWTNGGPGCSGLYGMGFENGPFLAQQDGSLTLNPMSWNRFATVRNIRFPGRNRPFCSACLAHPLASPAFYLRPPTARYLGRLDRATGRSRLFVQLQPW